jgi:L-seryl-tRNA(Ser) seleniumtransferase
VIVVNNASAAVLLCLNTFANRKEVVVSRGELVEIGGSFRIPEVMKAAGCKMMEVGTTNKTRITDYENAITKKTSVFFKAHQSNFVIKGFTEHAELSELVELGNKHNIPVIYDNGSGLLSKSEFEVLKHQSDVKTAIETGAGLVCFSGDKLLGGPQAGIIAGRKEYIAKLKKNQLLRALRVCKTTIAILEASCRQYLNIDELKKENYIYRSLSLTDNQIKEKALKLCKLLNINGVKSEIIHNDAMVGGGSSPENLLKSYAVKIIPDKGNKKLNAEYAEKLYRSLMLSQNPIVGILRKGELLFDMITVEDEDLEVIANQMTNDILQIDILLK